MKKIIVFLLGLTVVIILFGASCDVNVENNVNDEKDTSFILDPVLEYSFRQFLIKPNGELTPADLVTLTQLVVKGPGGPVLDLTGLEYAVNLESLCLHGNLTDIDTLGSLKKLTSLTLSGEVADISALAKLNKLERLTLACGEVSDLTPLSGLTALKDLTIVCPWYRIYLHWLACITWNS